MIKKINMSDLQPQDNPGDGWYHIEPSGEHPQHLPDGTACTLVLDDRAMELIVSSGLPPEGLLVDKDHLSHDDDQPTEAMGWSKDLAWFVDASGKKQLAAWIKWTPLGSPLVKGGIYKNFSTEYEIADSQNLGCNKYRPTRLVGLALTNRPNNKGQRPITNREKPCRINNINTNTTNMDPIEQIKAKLGLNPEAAIEDILAEIDIIKGAETEAAEQEAETLLNSEDLADVSDEDKKDLKEQLITNRELGMKMIGLLKNRGGKSPHYAKPGSRTDAGFRGADKGKEKADRVLNRAREIQRDARARGQNVSFWKAVRMAKGDAK